MTALVLARKFKMYCWGLKSPIKKIAKKIVIAKREVKNTSLPYFVLIHGTFSWIISSKYEDIIWDDIKEKLPKGTNSLYYVHID